MIFHKEIKYMKNQKLCLMFLIMTLIISCAHRPPRKYLVAPTVINAPINVVWKTTLAMLSQEEFKLKEVEHDKYFICAEKHNFLSSKERIKIKLVPYGKSQTMMHFEIAKGSGHFEDKAYIFDKIKAACEKRPLQSVLTERREKLVKNRPSLIPELSGYGFSSTFDCGYDTALKCAITALGNLGYMISQVNDRVGLLQASKTSDKVVWNFFYGVAENVFEKANVKIESLKPQKTKIRLILFEECHYHRGFGREKIEIDKVKHAKFYEPFFSELEHLIGLAKHQD